MGKTTNLNWWSQDFWAINSISKMANWCCFALPNPFRTPQPLPLLDPSWHHHPHAARTVHVAAPRPRRSRDRSWDHRSSSRMESSGNGTWIGWGNFDGKKNMHLMDQMEFLGGSKNWGFARKTVWMVYTMVPTWLKKCSPFRIPLNSSMGLPVDFLRFLWSQTKPPLHLFWINGFKWSFGWKSCILTSSPTYQPCFLGLDLDKYMLSETPCG